MGKKDNQDWEGKRGFGRGLIPGRVLQWVVNRWVVRECEALEAPPLGWPGGACREGAWCLVPWAGFWELLALLPAHRRIPFPWAFCFLLLCQKYSGKAFPVRRWSGAKDRWDGVGVLHFFLKIYLLCMTLLPKWNWLFLGSDIKEFLTFCKRIELFRKAQRSKKTKNKSL